MQPFFEGCNCRFFWHRKSTLLETKPLASARNFRGRWVKRSTILFCVERNPIYQCPWQVSEPFDDGDFWLRVRLLYTRGLSTAVFLGNRYQSLLLPAQFLSICVGMLTGEVAKNVKVFFIKATLKTWKLLLTSSTHSHVFSSCWGVGPAWGVSNDWRKRLHRRRQDATNSQKADGNNDEAGELTFDGLHRLAEKKLDRAVRVASLEKMLLPVRRLKKCVHNGQIVLKWSMNLQGRHSKMRFILVINVKKSHFSKIL